MKLFTKRYDDIRIRQRRVIHRDLGDFAIYKLDIEHAVDAGTPAVFLNQSKYR